jgi:iron complex transport system substrate-binding protein
VLEFYDLQADLCSELFRRGLNVVTFNQRSIAEILQMIRVLGGIVGCQREGEQLAASLDAGLRVVEESAARLPRRPRTFFEEWDDPLISGIRWVEELIEIAGGDPVFPELADARLARDRVVDPAEVIRRDPEVIIASWCGKRMNEGVIRSRRGWDDVTAVRHGEIHEVKSALILQPGPAALTDGVRALAGIIERSVTRPA